MACSLKVLGPADLADLQAQAGKKVTMTLAAPDGVVAGIIAIGYAGAAVPGPPFQFVIQPGNIWLHVLVDASLPDAQLQLQEDCGDGSTKPLETFLFKEGNPLQSYIVNGI